MQLESFGFLYPLLIMPRLEYHFVQPKRCGFCNLEAACVGGMIIMITELAKLRPTQLEIGTGLPVYHAGFFI